MSFAVDVTGVRTADGRRVTAEEAFRIHERDIRAVAKPRRYTYGLRHVQDVIGGAIRGLHHLLPRIVEAGSVFDLAKIEALPTLLAAFVHLATERVGPVRSPPERKELRAHGLEARRFLRRAFELGQSNGVWQVQLELTMGTSHSSIGSDLLHLVVALRQRALMGVATVLGDVELDGAEHLASLLMDIYSDCSVQKYDVQSDQRLRRQAFALLAEAYEEARFAVRTLVRNPKEADAIAPPLAKLKRKRGRKKAAKPEVADVGEPTAALESARPVSASPWPLDS